MLVGVCSVLEHLNDGAGGRLKRLKEALIGLLALEQQILVDQLLHLVFVLIDERVFVASAAMVRIEYEI